MRSFETTTKLMIHQSDAVTWLMPSRLNAILMEPGTGKSRVGIELAKLRHEKIDKVIWFTPVSLKLTARGEILKHTNCTRAGVFVFDDKVTESNIPDAMWYIIGIESMSQSVRAIMTANKLITEDSFVILDESTYCKNHHAKRTMRITAFSNHARYRAIMTGTVISNSISDLFAQFYFLSPKILGYNSFYSFAANHLEYSDKYPDMVVRSHNTEYLAAKIKPYTYQVTKDECLNIPDKKYVSAYFEMTEEQNLAYSETKEFFLNLLDTERFNSYTIFQLFNALQQIVSGFRNTRQGKVKYKHDRLETLMRCIQREDANEKIIIWAKFQYDVESIASELKKAYGESTVALYYGKVSEKTRKQEEERFHDKARFFVATPSTGGHGLTLVESATVKVYNRTFKYTENEQMEDRNHRIGQLRSPEYEDIHCTGSIDDHIWRSYCSKGNVLYDFKVEVDKAKKEGIRELIEAL